LPDALTIDSNGGSHSLADFSWLSGKTEDGRRKYVVTSERPFDYIRPSTKAQVERACVQRFRSDARKYGYSDPIFHFTANQDDPPDFYAELRGGLGRVGLECTLFTDERRRMLNARFQSVRERLLGEPPGAFHHLAYRLVQIDFTERNLVPRSSDDPVVAEIAQTLRTLQPDPALDHPGPVPPDRPGWPVRTPSGVGIDIVHLQQGYRPSTFARRMGFDLAMINGTIILDADDLRTEFESAIRRKDRAENDWLLVSAGAPDRTGRVLPGDSLVIPAAVVDRPPIADLRHLKRVIVHSWFSGIGWEIFPESKPLFRYQLPGTSAARRTFIDDIDVADLVRKPGRNDPCPCGSGSKFKRCCSNRSL
jgi:hypothetical protein